MLDRKPTIRVTQTPAPSNVIFDYSVMGEWIKENNPNLHLYLNVVLATIRSKAIATRNTLLEENRDGTLEDEVYALLVEYSNIELHRVIDTENEYEQLCEHLNRQSDTNDESSTLNDQQTSLMSHIKLTAIAILGIDNYIEMVVSTGYARTKIVNTKVNSIDAHDIVFFITTCRILLNRFITE